MPAPADAPFSALARQIDPQSTLRRTWPLHGGVSAQVTALELARADGSTYRLVARLHGPADLRQNPRIASDEYRLLAYLHTAGLPVPRPVYVAEAGTIFPTPCLVIEFVEGVPDLAPADLVGYLRQIADLLARIHQLADAPPRLAFLPQQVARLAATLHKPPPVLDESLDEGRIRAALAACRPLTPRNPTVLLHGDFWPGNVLWQEGWLAAVLDWEDARLGDPLADLGNARLELLFFSGPDAMQTFTDYYLAVTAWDATDLPYWDLVAALRPAGKLGTWGLPPAQEQAMRDRHHWFVAQALGHLSPPA